MFLGWYVLFHLFWHFTGGKTKFQIDIWLGFFEIPICIDIYCWIRLKKTYVRENVRTCVLDGWFSL